GLHTVRVVIKNTLGETSSAETRIITVIKPGNFEFLDLFSLSQAAALIEGDELVLRSVMTRDKTTKQQQLIDTRFRWFGSSQSFGMVQTAAAAQLSSTSALFARLWPSLFAALDSLTVPVQASPGVTAMFESPEANQITAGVGILRGWAFADG